MQTLTIRKELECPLILKRQTHMSCVACHYIAEYYDQKYCHNCGSYCKWSISWKNNSNKEHGI
jgi:hypothetical protein